ncbi:cystine-binding periplasmic domain protein, partial [Vibrio parahaemolyticus V-223/04]
RERRSCHHTQHRSNQGTRYFARWYVNICPLGNAQQAR